MAEATMPNTVAGERAEMKATINKWFAEMHRLNAEMKQDREEIERMSTEIRITMAETDAVLAKLHGA